MCVFLWLKNNNDETHRFLPFSVSFVPEVVWSSTSYVHSYPYIGRVKDPIKNNCDVKAFCSNKNLCVCLRNALFRCLDLFSVRNFSAGG